MDKTFDYPRIVLLPEHNQIDTYESSEISDLIDKFF